MISCASVSAVDDDAIISDVPTDSIGLETIDSGNVDIIEASEAEEDSLSDVIDDDPLSDVIDDDQVIGANNANTSHNLTDIKQYEPDADYSENHIYTISNTANEREFLSHFSEISSGYFFNQNNHQANIYWTPVHENVMYMIFWMDEDDFKNFNAFLTVGNQDIKADKYINNWTQYPNINVVQFSGITATSVNATLETNRNHGKKIKINGIHILNETDIELFINDKYEETVYVGEDATLKALVTLRNFQDVPVTEGIVSYYLYAVNGEKVLDMENLPNEQELGTSQPGGTIKTPVYPVGNYTFIAWYHDDTQAHNFESHSNKVILHVIPRPTLDLSIDKAVDNNNPYYGDDVTFTITVTNNGPANATVIKVNDTLPEGLVFVSANDTNYDDETGIWTIERLNAQESAVLEIVATLKSISPVENVANISSCREEDTDPSNDKDSVVVTPKPVVDLAITKEVNNPHPEENEEVTFTITVTNNGPFNATDVNVSDVLPTGLTFVSANGTYDRDGQTVVWNIERLDNGTSVSFVIKATFDDISQTLVNKANVTCAEKDTNEANNKAEAAVSALEVDLAVTKELATEGTIYYGDEVTFIITVTNKATSDLTNDALGVNVIDVLPAGLTFVSANGTYTNEGQEVVWTIDKLVSGETVSFKLVAIIGSLEKLTNNVEVTSHEKEVNPEDNKDSADVEADPIVNLAITKELANEGTIYYGDEVTFIITVTNNGPCDATDVKVTDVLPAGLTFVSANGTYTNEGQEVVWTIEKLDNGTTVTLKLVAIIESLEEINNVANVTSEEDEEDDEDNEDSVSVKAEPLVDLAVDIEITQTEVFYGDAVEYIITATNNGPCDATGVKVTDLIPEGFTYLADNSTGEEDYQQQKELYASKLLEDIPSFDQSTGIWTIGGLNSGDSVQLKILVKAGKLGENTISEDIKGNEHEEITDNNHDEDTILVKAITDLTVDKTVDKTEIVAGETVTYTITVTNNGPNDATGVKIDDIGITQHEFVSASSKDYNSSSGVWKVGDLANGESKELTVTVRINDVGEFANTVSVTGDQYDNDTSNNNASSDNVTVSEPPEEPEEPEGPGEPEESDDPADPEEPAESDEPEEPEEPEESDEGDEPKEPAEVANVAVLPKAGNPLFVLLLALMVLTGAMFERKE